MPKVANSSAIQNKFFETANIFVDRDEPRKNFWEIYNNYRAAHTNNPLFMQVLAYYGIGGVGKTKLLHKIATELDEKIANNARHIYFDFNDSQNPIEALFSIKNILIKKYKFEFPLFELGQYALAQKNGQDMKAPEAKSFLDKSPSLGILLDVAEILPVADLCAKLIKAVDSSVSFISNIVKKHKISVQAINTLEPQELQSYLPHLFAKDLNDNIETNDEPLVIFLDTYEQLVNEVKDGNTIHFADEWLKGDRGLVLNCHNVLWVIAGRERLKWIDLDSDWDGTLLQYSLGQFSESDSIDYLQKAGVEDSTLCKQISKLTSGVPIHLSLCVDVYNRIRESNGVPSINDFGDSFENLIPLFLKRLENESERLLVYLLSYIQTWDDALVKYVADRTLRGDWESSYRRLKVLSFITDTHDGKYNMHQTVSTSIRRSPGVEYQAIRKQIEKKSIEYAISRLEELSAFDSEYSYWLLWLTKFIVSNSSTEESVENQFAEFVYPYWNKLLDYGFFDLALNILDILQYNNLRQGNSWYLANILSLRAVVLNKKRDNNGAIKIGHDATEMYRLSPRIKYTIFGYNVIDSLTTLMGWVPESFYLMEFLLDMSCELFGIEDERTSANTSRGPIPENLPQEEQTRVQEKIKQIWKASSRRQKRAIILRLQEKKKHEGFFNKETLRLLFNLSLKTDSKEVSSKLKKACASISREIISRNQNIDNFATFSEVCAAYDTLLYCNSGDSPDILFLDFLTKQANIFLEKPESEDLLYCLQECQQKYLELPFDDSFDGYSRELIYKLSDKILFCYISLYGDDGKETTSFIKEIAETYAIPPRFKMSIEAYCKCLDLRVSSLKKDLACLLNKKNISPSSIIEVEDKICTTLWKKATTDYIGNHNAKVIYERLGEESIFFNESLLKHRLEFYGDVLENRDVLKRLSTLYEGKGWLEKAKEVQSLLDAVVISFYTNQWEMRCEMYGENHPEAIRCLNNLADNLLSIKHYEKSIETFEKLIESSRNLKHCSYDNLARYYHSIFINIGHMIAEKMDQHTIDSLLLKYLVHADFVPKAKDLLFLINAYKKYDFHSNVPYMDEVVQLLSKYTNDYLSPKESIFITSKKIVQYMIRNQKESYDEDFSELESFSKDARDIIKKIPFKFLNQHVCWSLGTLCLLYNLNNRNDESIACAKNFCEQQKLTDFHDSVLEFYVHIALLEYYNSLGSKDDALASCSLLFKQTSNPNKTLSSDPLFQLVKIPIGNQLTQTFLNYNLYEKALESANIVTKMIQEDKNVDPEQKAEAERLLKLAQENIGS